MIIIEPKVKFTKEDVECIKNLRDVCKTFGFTPWEVIDAVEDKCSLGIVCFEYEEEEN